MPNTEYHRRKGRRRRNKRYICKLNRKKKKVWLVDNPKTEPEIGNLFD